LLAAQGVTNDVRRISGLPADRAGRNDPPLGNAEKFTGSGDTMRWTNYLIH